jgi:hypothetical protein
MNQNGFNFLFWIRDVFYTPSFGTGVQKHISNQDFAPFAKQKGEQP